MSCAAKSPYSPYSPFGLATRGKACRDYRNYDFHESDRRYSDRHDDFGKKRLRVWSPKGYRGPFCGSF
ncbi:unnamed protein product [Gongylonema pulchrum]|uniref:Uncharacterized protein n=1 Tax=Gongylonema pulchrum TaxID=637853 RepID=A0A183EWS9_9BILA|nr:unnamed protein product [Gongylonema pulchrum]